MPKGVPAIYTSATLSLASLELFVHTAPDLPPANLLAIWSDFPDELPIDEITLSQLPTRWREIPGPAALQELGRLWIAEGKALTLSVPSVVVGTQLHHQSGA